MKWHNRGAQGNDPWQKKERRTSNVTRRRRKRRRWIWLIVLLLALVFSGLAYGYHYITRLASRMYEDVNQEQMRQADISLAAGEPVSILLAGLDNGALFYEDVEDARTDVMMIITINPQTKKSTILSVPRDALGPIDTSDNFDKLNHAYTVSGISGTINSLQRFLDVPIDYYVTVNMKGFIDIIDGMGGLDITSTQTFTQNGVRFKKGKQSRLNGVQAMQYVRMRKEDPEGDIGRQKRQQQLVQAVIDRVISLDTITNLDEIANKLGDSVKTNLTISDMYTLQSNYLDAIKKPEKLVFSDYSDLNLTFGWYLLISEADRQAMANRLRQNLGLSASNSAVLYPVDYSVNNIYIDTYDTNGDSLLTDDDMLIKPGVYKISQLKQLIKAKEEELGITLLAAGARDLFNGAAASTSDSDKEKTTDTRAKKADAPSIQQPVIYDNTQDAPVVELPGQ